MRMITAMNVFKYFNPFRQQRRQLRKIFLDYASTTPIDKSVQKIMNDYSALFFANPSALYTEALKAKDLVLEARKEIAEILSVQKNEIYFTSGGTEGNDLALLGVFEFFKTKDFIPHFITTKIEHPSVLEVCEEIARRGGEVTFVDVSEDGIVSVKDILGAIKENTVLVSIMYANNEIGTIQPIHEISRALKDFKNKNKNNLPYLHTDACQASLLSLNMQKIGADLVTLDGIKMYGPRGMGILAVRGYVKIRPIIFGGGQETGLRSGTENTAGILGIAKSLKIADEVREKESERLTELRDYLMSEILKNFPTASINGSKDKRLPNNVNVCFKGLDAEYAVIQLDVLGISCSYSSSCRTLKEDSSSYVIKSLGKEDCDESSLRFTFGRETTRDDIDSLLVALKKIIQQN
jgi:cysteine desulfurase